MKGLYSAKNRMCVLALVLAVFVYCTNATANSRAGILIRNSRQLRASNVLESACNSTLYPQLCVSTVLSHLRHKYQYNQSLRSSGDAIKGVAIASLEVTLEQVKRVSDIASSESSVFNSMDRKKRSAIQDCSSLLEYSLRQLNQSLERLTLSVEWKKQQADDVQTWLSASLTNQETCIEGFQRLKINQAESLLPNGVRNVSKLVSNSLAIVKNIPVANSSNHNNRRLLSYDGFPTWVSQTDRRLLQASPAGGVTADAVVAKDGSGNYRSISEAVEGAPSKSNGRYVIHVKAGVYAEQVEVSKDNIMLIGDGKYATVVTGSKSGVSLKSIATFAATGKGFIARDMGFENSAGPNDGQAIALRVASDQSAFYRCSMKANQDTLYAHSQRQFYRECDILGTVDFIFGNAAAVFQSCNIIARARGRGDSNFVTAQGRTDPNQNTGFSIHNSKVTAESGSPPTYLGRPWKQYSRTVFMQSFLDSSVPSQGWSEWSGSFALKTLYFAEYMNSGPGAGTANRVKWPGYHIITTVEEAGKFTVAGLISGNYWLPSTGVAFQSGLVG